MWLWQRGQAVLGLHVRAVIHATDQPRLDLLDRFKRLRGLPILNLTRGEGWVEILTNGLARQLSLLDG